MPSSTPFETGLELVLQLEGGVSNHPADRGGLTKYGVTQATFNEWQLRMRGYVAKSVVDATLPEIRSVFHDLFWIPGACDVMPLKLAIVQFDSMVQHRPKSAVKLLQRALWVDVDGEIGPKTREAARNADPGAAYALLTLRRIHYRGIVDQNPSQEVFLKGWMNRVDAVLKRVSTL